MAVHFRVPRLIFKTSEAFVEKINGASEKEVAIDGDDKVEGLVRAHVAVWSTGLGAALFSLAFESTSANQALSRLLTNHTSLLCPLTVITPHHLNFPVKHLHDFYVSQKLRYSLLRSSLRLQAHCKDV